MGGTCFYLAFPGSLLPLGNGSSQSLSSSLAVGQQPSRSGWKPVPPGSPPSSGLRISAVWGSLRNVIGSISCALTLTTFTLHLRPQHRPTGQLPSWSLCVFVLGHPEGSSPGECGRLRGPLPHSPPGRGNVTMKVTLTGFPVAPCRCRPGGKREKGSGLELGVQAPVQET